MTKTKRQLRAEAVERLRKLEGKAASYADYCKAMVDCPNGLLGQVAVTEIIDLLTDDELPEGDAVAILRKAEQLSDKHSNWSTFACICNAGNLTERPLGARPLGALADMVERDYVRRGNYDFMVEMLRHMTAERNEWKAKAEEEKANAEGHWRNANNIARERDEWKAKAEQATNQPTSQSDAPKTAETAENDASKCEIRDFVDSREKLEADMRHWCDIIHLEGYQRDMIWCWLNRQADITAGEWCHAIDGLSDENDELRAEIAERYMELPVDADGVPIHVGDELETAHGGKVIVEYVGECEVRVYRDGEHYRIFQDEYAYTCRHVKPRTIEDILTLFLTAVGDDDPHYYDEQIAEYADEIRAMFGGDAE